MGLDGRRLQRVVDFDSARLGFRLEVLSSATELLSILSCTRL